MRLLNPAVARVLKRLHYPLDVKVMCVRRHVAYGQDVRNPEVMMTGRGFHVRHLTVHRWVLNVRPVLKKVSPHHKRPVRRGGPVHETDIEGKGKGSYLYQAVDTARQAGEFLLRVHRDKAAAKCCFKRSIDQNGEPETVTIDKSGSKLAALGALNAERAASVKIRQIKYLNNMMEQDYRDVEAPTRPTPGLKISICPYFTGRYRAYAFGCERADANSISGPTPAKHSCSFSR